MPQETEAVRFLDQCGSSDDDRESVSIADVSYWTEISVQYLCERDCAYHVSVHNTSYIILVFSIELVIVDSVQSGCQRHL